MLHQLVLELNSGAAITGEKFTKVIFVGHSYGSVLGNYLAVDHPSDFVILILTGFGNNLAYAADGLNATLLTPASSFAPRFSGLSPGYMVISSQNGRRTYFYGPPGSFDEQLFQLDFPTQDEIGLREAFSLSGGLRTASSYTGLVFVLTVLKTTVFAPTLNAVQDLVQS